MRLLSLLPACLLATCALAQDPVPGDPAPEYTDGKFFEPNGALFNYDEGSRMNISWVSKYETHNVWLIVGYDYGKPIKVASNISQSWVQWDVRTPSTNATEIYVFRVVNGLGTDEEKRTGGFVSAPFYIPNVEPSPSSTSSTSSSTSASSTSSSTSASSTGSSTSTSSTTSAPSNPAQVLPQRPPEAKPKEGVSDGTKIGIGVGVGVGVLGLGALIAALLFWRRMKKRQQPPATGDEPPSVQHPLNAQPPYHDEHQAMPAGYPGQPPLSQMSQPYNDGQQAMAGYPNQSLHPQTTQPYSDEQRALAGYYKPPGTVGSQGTELDAGQYQYVAEVDGDPRGNRAELQ